MDVPPKDGVAEQAADGVGDGAGDADAPMQAEVMDVAPEVVIDAPVDVPVDRPPPTDLVNGSSCQADSWCRSHFCVDGVCCNTVCEREDPMRCNGCSMAKTGQRDGLCAADKTRERMRCGLACGQVLMNVPAVLSMTCQQGACKVPEVPDIVDTCRKMDACTSSFCNQPTNRTASCVHNICPTGGTCCCQTGAGDLQRSCVSTTACKNERMCVSQ